MIEVKIASKSETKDWNELVAKSDNGTIFHTWEWLKIVEVQTKSRLYPLIGYKGETVVGMYPLFLQKRGPLKLVLSPPPNALLLYLGPAFLGYNKLKQSRKETLFFEFQQKVDEFIKNEIGGNYTRIRTTPYILDSRPLKWNGYDVDPLYTYFIDLTGGVESVWRNLNRKLRVSIEKTRREGVVIEDGDLEDLEFLRVSLYERFLEQGLKPKKDYYKWYLKELYKTFYPKNMKIIVAKYNGERVGGLVVLFYKNWSALWIGIPKTDLKGIYPNDLAQWEAIKWACQNGYKYYEEMDAGDDPRLRHFKAKFNPELAPWYSATKCSSQFYKIAETIFNFIRRK